MVSSLHMRCSTSETFASGEYSITATLDTLMESTHRLYQNAVRLSSAAASSSIRPRPNSSIWRSSLAAKCLYSASSTRFAFSRILRGRPDRNDAAFIDN
ncbi:hypothetical protein MTO96_024232 [Rhipicephalus appendiculatus]